MSSEVVQLRQNQESLFTFAVPKLKEIDTTLFSIRAANNLPLGFWPEVNGSYTAKVTLRAGRGFNFCPIQIDGKVQWCAVWNMQLLDYSFEDTLSRSPPCR